MKEEKLQLGDIILHEGKVYKYTGFEDNQYIFTCLDFPFEQGLDSHKIIKYNRYSKNIKKFDFQIGDIVKVTNPGHNYSTFDRMFSYLNFKNKKMNRIRDYELIKSSKFKILNMITYDTIKTILFHIVNITDESEEYLIDCMGVEFLERLNDNFQSDLLLTHLNLKIIK